MKPALVVGLLCWSVAAVSAGEPEQFNWTIRLTVPLAKAPVPALKYALLPELRQQSPGNAALLYYRAFSPEWLTHRQPDARKQFNAWLENTKQKPGAELRWILNYRPIDEVSKAAR